MTPMYILSAIIYTISIQLSSCTLSCGNLVINCNNGNPTCYSGPCASMATYLTHFNRLPFWTNSPTTKPTNMPTTITTSPTPKPTFYIPNIPFNTIKPINPQQTIPNVYTNRNPLHIITQHSIITKYPTTYPTVKPTSHPIITNKPTTNPNVKPTPNPTNKPISPNPIQPSHLGAGSSSESSSSDAQSVFKQKENLNLDLDNNIDKGNLSGNQILFANKILFVFIFVPLAIIILFGLCCKWYLIKKQGLRKDDKEIVESDCILYDGYDEDTPESNSD